MAALNLIIGVLISSIFSLLALIYGISSKTLYDNKKSPWLWGAILWGVNAFVTYFPLSIVLLVLHLNGYVDLFIHSKTMALIAFAVIAFTSEAIRYRSLVRGTQSRRPPYSVIFGVAISWGVAEMVGRFIVPPLLTNGSNNPLKYSSYYLIMFSFFIAHFSLTVIAYHTQYSSKYLVVSSGIRYFFEVTYLGLVATRGYDGSVTLIMFDSLLILALAIVIYLGKKNFSLENNIAHTSTNH